MQVKSLQFLDFILFFSRLHPFCLQIVCRCSTPLDTAVKEKISMFCHVEPEQVICVHDVSSIYRVPLLLENQGIVDYFCRRLDLPIEMRPRKMLTKWKEMSDRFVLFGFA